MMINLGTVKFLKKFIERFLNNGEIFVEEDQITYKNGKESSRT